MKSWNPFYVLTDAPVVLNLMTITAGLESLLLHQVQSGTWNKKIKTIRCSKVICKNSYFDSTSPSMIYLLAVEKLWIFGGVCESIKYFEFIWWLKRISILNLNDHLCYECYCVAKPAYFMVVFSFIYNSFQVSVLSFVNIFPVCSQTTHITWIYPSVAFKKTLLISFSHGLALYKVFIIQYIIIVFQFLEVSVEYHSFRKILSCMILLFSHVIYMCILIFFFLHVSRRIKKFQVDNLLFNC